MKNNLLGILSFIALFFFALTFILVMIELYDTYQYNATLRRSNSYIIFLMVLVSLSLLFTVLIAAWLIYELKTTHKRLGLVEKVRDDDEEERSPPKKGRTPQREQKRVEEYDDDDVEEQSSSSKKGKTPQQEKREEYERRMKEQKKRRSTFNREEDW